MTDNKPNTTDDQIEESRTITITMLSVLWEIVDGIAKGGERAGETETLEKVVSALMQAGVLDFITVWGKFKKGDKIERMGEIRMEMREEMEVDEKFNKWMESI